MGGKTGTSNEQKDSWFVGYAGDYLVLVWLGFDDNRPTPLTGRSGSFQVWKHFIQNINPINTTKIKKFSRVNYEWVDMKDGLLSGKKCKNSILIPFLSGTEPKELPKERKKCRSLTKAKSPEVLEKLRKIFNKILK